jgi:hypothetical protein
MKSEKDTIVNFMINREKLAEVKKISYSRGLSFAGLVRQLLYQEILAEDGIKNTQKS